MKHEMILTETEILIYKKIFDCQDDHVKKFWKLLYTICTNRQDKNVQIATFNINRMLKAYLNYHYIPPCFRDENILFRVPVDNQDFVNETKLDDIINAIDTSDILDTSQKHIINTYVSKVIDMYNGQLG